MMIFACNEHIELALDVAVDEWEVPPVVEKCGTEHHCNYCEEKAEYTVAK